MGASSRFLMEIMLLAPVPWRYSSIYNNDNRPFYRSWRKLHWIKCRRITTRFLTPSVTKGKRRGNFVGLTSPKYQEQKINYLTYKICINVYTHFKFFQPPPEFFPAFVLLSLYYTVNVWATYHFFRHSKYIISDIYKTSCRKIISVLKLISIQFSWIVWKIIVCLIHGHLASYWSHNLALNHQSYI